VAGYHGFHVFHATIAHFDGIPVENTFKERFKERFRNHQKSFNIATYANDTELSKYIWILKKSNRPYKIKWTILKHSTAYRSGHKQCNLCSDEKLYIMKFTKNSLLTKRSETFSNCVHQKQFLAGSTFACNRTTCAIIHDRRTRKHARASKQNG
jgi:hypothetical protein